MTHAIKSPTGSSSALTLGVKELQTTGLYSDVTLVCGGQSFKVHRSILHPQSSVFRKLFSGKYKEDGQRIIELDDDPSVFQVLISFLYTFVYNDNSRQSTESISAFTIRVYAIADKYDVPPLRTLASQKLRNVCQPQTNLDDYVSAIQTADELTNPKDTTLWEILIPKTIENIKDLLTNPATKELILGTETLNVALLSHLALVHPDRCGVHEHRSPTSPRQSWESGEDDDENDDEDPAPRYGRGGRLLGMGRRLGGD